MEIARALTKRYKPQDGPHPSASQQTVTSPNRTVSRRHKDSNAAINRAKISLPIELISTTNVLAYNAPDIYPHQQQQQHSQDSQILSPALSNPESVPSTASSSASTRSYDDSASDRDGSSSTGTALTAVTTPDTSREGSPAAFADHDKASQLREYFRAAAGPASPVTSPVDRPDNHAASSFDRELKKQQQQQQSAPSRLVTKDIPTIGADQLPTPQSPAPLVPTRALSHTKKTHQALARRRSRSRNSDPASAAAAANSAASAQVPPLSPTMTVSSNGDSSSLSLPTPAANANANASATTPAQRTSQEMFANRINNSSHPFGAELAQVKELAEEFGVRDVRVWSDEEQFLQEHGLFKFGVEDYLSEIRPLFAGVFAEDAGLAGRAAYEELEGERGRDRAAECFAGGTAWF